MTNRDEGRRISQLIGGLLLLLVGALLVLQNLGLLHAGSLSDYWPLFLVWIGATRLLAPGRGERAISGAVVLGLGVFFQLERLGWTSLSLAQLWPVFMVAAGVALILEGLRSRRSTAAPAGPGAAGPGGRR
ncbi:MAG: LiaI-LiaF-like domain-containing protein [Acidobacteriota bacterium]